MKQKAFVQRAAGGAVALAAALVLLSGCATSTTQGGGSGGSTGGAGIAAAKAATAELASNPPLKISPLPTPAKKGVNVAFVNCTLPACLPDGGVEPGAALGWNVKNFPYDIAKGPTDVLASLDSAISSKPDVLIVSQGFGEALVKDRIDAANKAGIKVINIGATEDAPGYVACIQCSPALDAQGRAVGNAALADAGSPTAVGIVTDKNYTALVALAGGVSSAIKENGDGSTSQELDLNLADNPAANASRTVSFLQRNPDIKYLLYTTPAFIPGTSSALAAAGLNVKVIAMNPSNDAEVAMITSGDVYEWVAGESGDKAFVWRVFDAAARAVQGAPIDPKSPITVQRLITKDNVNPSLQAPTDFRNVYKTAWGVN